MRQKMLIKGICAFLTIACMGLGMGVISQAADSEKEDFQIVYAVNNETTPIDGAEFSSVQVAQYENSTGTFELNDQFKGISYDPNDINTADVSKAAKDFLSFQRKSSVEAVKLTTDANGRCTFSGVYRGLYLIWQDHKTGTASKYETAEPTLLYVMDGNAIAYPKTEKISSSGGGGENPSKHPSVTKPSTAETTQAVNPNPDDTGNESNSKTGMPKTGDARSRMMFGSIIISCILVFIWLFGRKKKSSDNE